MRISRQSNRAQILRGGLISFLAAISSIPAASAANFVVNTLTDENDGVGTNGVSLRDAINAANADTAADTITFSVTGTITLTADLPNITEDLTISGPGAASIILHGTNAYRAFKIMNSADVTISGIAVNNMYASGGDGWSSDTGGGGGGAAGMGAAVFVNSGSVVISAVQFSGNASVGGDGGGDDGGSGMYAGAGGGGLDGSSGSGYNGAGGGFLGGVGGAGGCTGADGGEGAGGGGGWGCSPYHSGAGGFGGGGAGGVAQIAMSPGNTGGIGGLGGGGGGGGLGWTGWAGASGGTFGGTGGTGSSGSQGGGGGGAGLGGAIFARAGTAVLLNCSFTANSATGGSGALGGTGGQGKGGAIFVNSGATVIGSNLTFSGNSAADDTNTTGDNNDVYGTLGSLPVVSSIARASANPTNASQVNFTVTFNTAVTGVNAADFQVNASGVSGASVQSVNGSGTTYTVAVNTGTGDGSLALNLVDDDSIVDGSSIPLGGSGAGNGDFTAGESYSIDKAAPAITLASSSPTTTNSALTVTATLSESSSGFAAEDVSATNGIVSNFSGSGTSYGFTVTPVGSGTVAVVVNAGAFNDEAGNANTVSNTLDRTYDAIRPTVFSVTPAASALTTETSTTFTVTFSEDVSGFDASDVSVTHTGTAGDSPTVSATSASVYVVTVGNLSGNGSFTLAVAAECASDAAGNTNLLGLSSAAVSRQAPPTTTGGTPVTTTTTEDSTTPTSTTTTDEATGDADGEADGESAIASETAGGDELVDTASCGGGLCGPIGLTQLLTLAGLLAMKRARADAAVRRGRTK